MPPVHRNERDHPQCHHPCLFQGYTPVQDMRLATDQRPPHRTLEISRERETGNMDNNKPGIKHSMNAPMPCEKQAVLDYVHLEETADDYSLHVLACKGAEKGLFYVAATTIRLILFEAGLLSGRRPPISRMGAGISAISEPTYPVFSGICMSCRMNGHGK